MLSSVLAQTGAITSAEIALCTAVALGLGLVISVAYMFRNNCSKAFAVTLVLLPVIIQSVIMVVNGNLGAGVAVMGAFSLIRFRSAPGNAKEILVVFFSMAAGLACGMGYVVYAALFTFAVCTALLVLTLFRFGEATGKEKHLRITIPENLDYTHLFDDLFAQHTQRHTLQKVRTTNMGGLYELQYLVTLKNNDTEKELLDAIRQRNGNLSIACGVPVVARDEL